MNELIRESDPIEPVQQDGILRVSKKEESDDAIKGLMFALPAALLFWAIVLGGLFFYLKRG